MPSGVRELIALSLLAGFGWGLAWARDDLIFVGVFAGATVMTVVEAIRRSRWAIGKRRTDGGLGLVTSAVKRGVNLLKICDQTRHKSVEMLRVYCRDAELFNGNAAAGLL
jgi:hypothetical protein